MARTVFANNRNFSHKGSGDKSLSSAPDMCKTPVGSATPPLPYPVVSQAADADGYTASVFIDGNPTAIASSIHSKCSGDEAGSAKGLISGKTSDKTEFMSYSFDVRCEGEGAVRHQDLTMMNSGNTMGSVLGVATSPSDIEDEQESEGILIDFYITDYEEELRIDETIPGEKIWLNVRTRNLIGELVTINLDNSSVDFKYQDELLVNDTLKDYKITKDHEKIELDVEVQRAEVTSMYFTDMNNNIISETYPGDKVKLIIESKGMISEIVALSLNNNTVDFKYEGNLLKKDVLKGYKINEDIEVIVLDVVNQEG